MGTKRDVVGKRSGVVVVKVKLKASRDRRDWEMQVSAGRGQDEARGWACRAGQRCCCLHVDMRNSIFFPLSGHPDVRCRSEVPTRICVEEGQAAGGAVVKRGEPQWDLGRTAVLQPRRPSWL